jgi:hypothetical protein
LTRLEGSIGYDAEDWAWCDEARERYEERIAILSDGGKIIWQMDRIA